MLKRSKYRNKFLTGILTATVFLAAFKKEYRQAQTTDKCQKILSNKEISTFAHINYSEYLPNDNSWDCDCEYYTIKGYGYQPVEVLYTYDPKKKLWASTRALYDSVEKVKDLGEEAYYIVLRHSDIDEINLHVFYKKNNYLMIMPAYQSEAEAKAFMDKVIRRYLYETR